MDTFCEESEMEVTLETERLLLREFHALRSR